MQTKLKISQAGFPPMSMGNCSQIIMPLAQQKIWRSINGEALVTEAGQVKKYKTKIYGEDANLPCFDGIDTNTVIEIESIQRIWRHVPAEYEDAIELAKVPVDGSVVAMDKDKNLYDLEQTGDKEFILRDGSMPEELFIGYFPKFTMIVTNLKVSHEEWEGTYKWELEAEET